MATASFTKGFWVFHNVFTFMLHSTAFVTITLIAGSTVEGFGLKPLHKHTVCAYTHTIANAQPMHMCINTDTHTGTGVCVVRRACWLWQWWMQRWRKSYRKGVYDGSWVAYNIYVNQTVARGLVLIDNRTYGLMHACIHTNHTHNYTHKNIIAV